MSYTKAICMLLLCIGLFAAVTLFTEDTFAADRGTTADKDIATKQGVGESLGSKTIDKDKLPGTLEIGFAVGSIITMIAVLKYL
jgi:hypothetical protein